MTAVVNPLPPPQLDAIVAWGNGRVKSTEVAAEYARLSEEARRG